MSEDRGSRRPDDPQDVDDAGPGLRRRIEGFIPSVIKRTVSHGVGAAQITEDVLRSVVGEMKLPKEAVGYIVEVADNTRREVVRVAAREFREFLESANLTEEMVRLLTAVSFEVRTEIRFVPNDQRLKPTVKSHVQVKGDTADAEAHAAQPIRDSGLVEVIDDIFRAGAAEVADLLIGRRRRPRAADAGPAPEPVVEPPAEAPAPKPATSSRRKRTTKKATAPKS
jgi:hypothetical protein